ncbi:MAG: AI-2E family transporter, partial [Candidatus Binatia bacterium]
VVTALAQAVWGGLGLVIAGVPYAGVLTAVMLLLCVAQIGVIPVLGSALAWLYWTGDTTWGTFLLIWTIMAATMDNFMRPVLIKKGANLPLLLVFSGVVGGLLAFGLIGIFVGPVVLAVADTMLSTWIESDSGDAETNERSGSVGG